MISPYNNEVPAFHNILELGFHKIVTHEGHLVIKLLTKMDSMNNMKTKSNFND